MTNLDEQITKMVADGACIWDGQQLLRLGWVSVDEPKNRLFFMLPWAKESGDVRLLRWRSYDSDDQSVRFYGGLGQVVGILEPIAACVGLNQETPAGPTCQVETRIRCARGKLSGLFPHGDRVSQA